MARLRIQARRSPTRQAIPRCRVSCRVQGTYMQGYVGFGRHRAPLTCMRMRDMGRKLYIPYIPYISRLTVSGFQVSKPYINPTLTLHRWKGREYRVNLGPGARSAAVLPRGFQDYRQFAHSTMGSEFPALAARHGLSTNLESNNGYRLTRMVRHDG